MVQPPPATSMTRVFLTTLLVGLLAVGSTSTASAQSSPYCQAGQSPQFSLGFASLKEAVGADMGVAVECEHTNADNGDTLQQTSSGISFYRKSTNTPTFTNGSDHWGLTTDGLIHWAGAGIDPPGVLEPLVAQPVATPTPTPAALTEADIAALVSPSVVQVLLPDEAGSGVSVAAGVITNEHVVHGADRVELLTNDGRRFGATVRGTDLLRDLALLSPDLPVPPIELESAGQQRQGDQLLVLGYPRPSILGIGGQASLSRGLLSAIRQDNGITYIQTDATVNPGNSGGPVLNMRGNVVGVVDFTLKDSVGLNFAIATESIQAFLAAPPTSARLQSTPNATPAPFSPAISAPIFRDDPRSVATTSVDISADGAWIQTYEGSSASGNYQRLLGYHGSRKTQIVVSVVVMSSIELADADWLRANAKLSPGWELVTPPSIADAQFTERKTGQLSVRARAKNVTLILNLESEDPSYSPYDMLVSKVRQMADRVNAQAR